MQPIEMQFSLKGKEDPEDPSNMNMVNGIKQCLNLNDTTFTIFIDDCEGN